MTNPAGAETQTPRTTRLAEGIEERKQLRTFHMPSDLQRALDLAADLEVALTLAQRENLALQSTLTAASELPEEPAQFRGCEASDGEWCVRADDYDALASYARKVAKERDERVSKDAHIHIIKELVLAQQRAEAAEAQCAAHVEFLRELQTEVGMLAAEEISTHLERTAAEPRKG